MGLDKLLGLGKLSQQDFAEYVAKVAAEQEWLDDPEIDLEAFSIRSRDHEINLANIYQSFLAAPRTKRAELVRGTLEALLAADPLPESFADAALQLIPRLRDEGFVALHALASQGKHSAGIVTRPVAPGLVATVVIDGPRSMTTVHRHTLEAWGIGPDELFEQAIHNLLEASSPSFEQIAADVWLWVSEDAYAASRVLLPHVLQSVAFDPLVTVPHRDMLLVANARSEGAITKLVAIMESQLSSETYPITRTIYQLQETAYTPISLPDDHPVAMRYGNLLRLEAASRYREESPLLQELVGEDVFVANHSLQQDDEGRLRSYAVWTEGVDTLLPQVDVVVLLDLDNERGWEVSWDALLQPGDLIEPTDYPLPRWRTGPFPDALFLEDVGQPLEQG